MFQNSFCCCNEVERVVDLGSECGRKGRTRIWFGVVESGRFVWSSLDRSVTPSNRNPNGRVDIVRESQK